MTLEIEGGGKTGRGAKFNTCIGLHRGGKYHWANIGLLDVRPRKSTTCVLTGWLVLLALTTFLFFLLFCFFAFLYLPSRFPLLPRSCLRGLFCPASLIGSRTCLFHRPRHQYSCKRWLCRVNCYTGHFITCNIKHI